MWGFLPEWGKLKYFFSNVDMIITKNNNNTKPNQTKTKQQQCLP